MIQDLLKRWSELEPDRCRWIQDDLNDGMVDLALTKRQETYRVSIGSFNISDELSICGLGVLQYALQQAIAAHDARCQIENGKGGWFVVACSNDQSFYQQETDEEPAIALLSAYVKWLEQLLGEDRPTILRIVQCGLKGAES